MIIINSQQNYFKKIEEISAVPLQIANLSYKSDIHAWTPGMRFNPDKYDIHDERNVAINEVVFDFDYSSYKKNYRASKDVIDVLERRRMPYYICYTGGKGVHIHCFYDKLIFSNDNTKELMKKAFSLGMAWKHIRLFIWNNILDEAGIEEKHRGHGKQLDSAPMNFNFFNGTSHLIRDIGGRKPYKDVDGDIKFRYKTYIPKKEFNAKKPILNSFDDVLYPDKIEYFTIDEEELAMYLNNFIKIAENKQIAPLKNVRIKVPYTELDAVLKLRENGAQSGQRSFGAQIIAVACKIDQLSKEKATEIMQEYVNNCQQLGHPFTLKEAIQWINWIYNQQYVFWNCSQLEELGIHDPEQCEFCQVKNRKSNELLLSESILSKIKNVMDIQIVGENDNKMLIFLLSLSKDFPSNTGKPNWCIPSDPMSQNIILSSDSSSGKTYIVKQILKLFGEENVDYFVISRLTKSAINYYTDINMDGKIMFVEELQGLDENTSQLRVWMSEGRLSLDTVEKVMNEEGVEVNTLVRKTTMGQPVFITCQAEGKVEEQLNNRGWVISTDVSDSQTSEILKFQDDLHKGNINNNTEDIRIIRDALKQLKQYHFKIPFANNEIMKIPFKDVRSRRDYEKFLTLIKCSAYLHQKQRVIEKDEAGNEYIICDIKDYDIARNYSEGILGATFSGLTTVQIDLINKLRGVSWKEEFTISDVQRNMGKSHTYWHGLFRQLEDLGYVTVEKSNGNQSIFTLNDKAYNIMELPSGKELLAELEIKNPDQIKKIPVEPKQELFKIQDVLNFIKEFHAHTVSFEDLSEKFKDDDRLTEAIDKLKTAGDIWEVKPAKYMLL